MSNPNLHPTSLYDLSIGVGYCSLALLWNHLSLSRMLFWEWGGLTTSTTFLLIPLSLLIFNCLLLTVELDLDQGDVRHGGELSLNLFQYHAACYHSHSILVNSKLFAFPRI